MQENDGRRAGEVDPKLLEILVCPLTTRLYENAASQRICRMIFSTPESGYREYWVLSQRLATFVKAAAQSVWCSVKQI